MTDEEFEEAAARAMDRFMPGHAQGATPGRDHIQAELTAELVTRLSANIFPVSVVLNVFIARREPLLSWLGEQRQNAMILAVQQQTGLDLTKWIENPS